MAGVLAFGGFALGVGAQGGIAVGWQATGFVAAAWSAAQGSFAFAHDFAIGDFVRAAHTNTDVARQFINSSRIFRFFYFENRHAFLVNFLWIAPLFIQWRLIARSRRSRK